MGMFNEIYKRSPCCDAPSEAQISQVVLGFGNFDLDDPASLARQLDEDQLRELARKARDPDTRFECSSCKRGWRFGDAPSERQSRVQLAQTLFGGAPDGESR